MAADQGLITGAYRAAMANVQKDYSKFYQAEAAGIAGMASALAERADKLEKEDAKNKERLNKYTDETLMAGASGTEQEQAAVETKLNELADKWEKSSKSERRRVEAEIVNIGTKIKAHNEKKLLYSTLHKNGNLLGGSTIYDNEINAMVMQNSQGDEGWKAATVTLDENNNFVYMGLTGSIGDPDREVIQVNSADWGNSFQEDKKTSEKSLATLSTNASNKGAKGIEWTTTDDADLVNGIKAGVISNNRELQKVIAQSRFKNANGELVNFEAAFLSGPEVAKAIESVTAPGFIRKYDKNDDGKVTEDEFTKGAALKTLINNITQPYDPVSGKKNENYIGFDAAQEIVAGVLKDSIKTDKYNPALAKYTKDKNTTTPTLKEKDRKVQIQNVNALMTGAFGGDGQNITLPAKEGEKAVTFKGKTISNLPGGKRIDFAEDGKIYEVYYPQGATEPQFAQINPQKALDVIFGPAAQDWNNWKKVLGNDAWQKFNTIQY